MTFVLAWKYQDSLCCVFDTAVTRPGKEREPLSSFGELQEIQRNGSVVEEATVKIIPVGTKTAIAYSGSVYYARIYISQITTKITFNKTIHDILLETANINPIPKEYNLKLMLLHHDDKEGAQILIWDSKNPTEVIYDQEWTTMGSLS